MRKKILFAWAIENKRQDILNPLLSNSISKGNKDYINKYIKAGGDLNIAIDEKGATMLEKANQEGIKEIANILESALNIAGKAGKAVKVSDAESKARRESKGIISAIKNSLLDNNSNVNTNPLQNKEANSKSYLFYK